MAKKETRGSPLSKDCPGGAAYSLPTSSNKQLTKLLLSSLLAAGSINIKPF